LTCPKFILGRLQKKLFKMKKLLFTLGLLCSVFMVQAQMVSISGSITNANGMGVPNVQVLISNPMLGIPSPVGWAMTDNSGSYYWTDTVGGFPVATAGTAIIEITDCNGNMLNQIVTFTPNLLILTADFIYCSNPGGNSCSLNLSPITMNGNNLITSANLTGGVSPNTYSWMMGDGTNYTTQGINHTYAAAGTYGVCAVGVDATGCIDSLCFVVTTMGSGGGNCSVTSNNFPDSTNYLTNYFFANASGGTAPYTYTWDFGDNSMATSANPTHTYSQSGTYNACVTITDATGCVSTDCQTVFVFNNTPCITSISVGNSPANPLMYSFTAANLNNPNMGHFWDFGDGTIDSMSGLVTHTYAQAGTYQVCLTEINFTTGCVATDCQTITVSGGTSCQAFITYNNTMGSLVVDFFGTSSTNNNPVTYTWDFGDSSTSTLQNPTHTYNTIATGPVTYNVVLTVTDANGCISIATETITVFPGSPSGQIIGYLWKDTLNFTPADGLVYLIEYDSVNGGILTAIDTIQTQQGFFDFQNVPTGLYLIKAALLPTDADYANYLPTYFIQSLSWGNAQYISPVPFGLPALIDIQLVQGNNLGGPGFIGGLVANGAGRPVTGDVTLVEDILDLEPMEGVSVLLLDANNNAVTHTVTDADGAYSFSNIAMGTYKVHVEELGKVTFDATVVIDANNMNHDAVHFTVHSDMVTLTGVYDVANIENFQVFPNPVSDAATVQIQLNESMDATLTVTNLMGQTMVNQNMRLNAGDNTFTVEMSDLPAGLYLLSVKSGTDVITYKVQKQ
jgi:PKD repeat protein